MIWGARRALLRPLLAPRLPLYNMKSNPERDCDASGTLMRTRQEAPAAVLLLLRVTAPLPRTLSSTMSFDRGIDTMGKACPAAWHRAVETAWLRSPPHNGGHQVCCGNNTG
jgi:hypothetical protein